MFSYILTSFHFLHVTLLICWPCSLNLFVFDFQSVFLSLSCGLLTHSPSSGWLYSQEYCLLISFLLAHYLWHRKPLPTTSVTRSVLMILEYIFQIYIYTFLWFSLPRPCLVWPISMMGSGITLYHCIVLCHWTYTSHYNFLFPSLVYSISMDNGGL